MKKNGRGLFLPGKGLKKTKKVHFRCGTENALLSIIVVFSIFSFSNYFNFLNFHYFQSTSLEAFKEHFDLLFRMLW